MSLADTIAKLNAENNTNTEEESVNPTSRLAHQPLQLTKKSPKLIVRILPPAPGNEIMAEYRRWFTSYENKGQKRYTAFTLSAKPDDNDPLEQHVQDMDAAGRLDNKWGNKNYPTHRYLFNVVPYHYDEQTGLTMITDSQGLPDVYVLDANKTQAIELINALSEQLNNPNLNPQLLQSMNLQPTQEQKDYSFASSALGYAVLLSWEKNGNAPVKFGQQILTQFPLAPLPQGWETKLEDLVALTEPSYKNSKSFVDWVIAQDNSLIAQQPATAPHADSQQVNVNFPSGMGIQAQPTAQSQVHSVATPVEAPTYQAQQSPTAPIASVSATAPVAPQQPVAPVQAPASASIQTPAPSAPTPQQSPLAGLGNTIASKAPAPQPVQVQPQPQPQSPAPTSVPEDLSSQVADVLKNAGLDDLNLNL